MTCRDRCALRPLIWQCSDDKRGRFRAQALFALGLLIAGMGTLELPGGHLIWSHWEAWMMAAWAKAAGHTSYNHTIDMCPADDGVSDAFAHESLSQRGRLHLMNSRSSPGQHAGGCLFRRLIIAATASHLQLHASSGITAARTSGCSARDARANLGFASRLRPPPVRIVFVRSA